MFFWVKRAKTHGGGVPHAFKGQHNFKFLPPLNFDFCFTLFNGFFQTKLPFLKPNFSFKTWIKYPNLFRLFWVQGQGQEKEDDGGDDDELHPGSRAEGAA